MTDRYKNLKPFVQTLRQTEVLDAIIDCNGNQKRAAKKLSVAPGTIHAYIKRLERYAALRGFSPDHDMTHVVPDSHYIRGTSTLYRTDPETGEETIALQWVKSNAKIDDQMQCLREFAEGLAEPLKGKATPVKLQSKNLSPDLLTVYPVADVHLGMLAWHEETGEDYDLNKASEALKIAAQLLVGRSIASEQAIVANLGDFFHFDNDEKRTKASGNSLDVDGRWSKVVRLGVECLRFFIQEALKKHEHVKVINSIGNHDDQSALMLPLILEPYYANEPRVTIETLPRYYHYHRFGANLLGFHHGHKTSPKDLPMVMVNDQRKEFGETEFSHWLTGHIHHESKEYDGVLVESFRTLAAKDAYHSSHRYRALRDIQSIQYHREFGECGRNRLSYKLIQSYL